MVAHIRTTV